MTIFLRLLTEKEKDLNLLEVANTIRAGGKDVRILEVTPESFRALPGAPFAYWVSSEIRSLFKKWPTFEREYQTVRQGVATADDFRFARCWWEVEPHPNNWPTFSKGGAFSPFYDPLPLVVNWKSGGAELIAFPASAVRNPSFYFREGLTWPLRAHTFCPQPLPAGTVFSTRGSAIFSLDPLLYLGLFSSSIIDTLLRLLSGREGHPQYDMGDISLLPIPKIDDRVAGEIRRLAKNGWSIQRNRDSIEEISHSFLLPLRLRSRVSEFDFDKIDSEIDEIRRDINTIVFDVYGVTEGDRASVHKGHNTSEVVESQSEEVANVAGEEEDTLFPADQTDGLLSWAVGVSFGRFDWRLATGERVDPLEPGPFDPLPAKSPGMLPDDLEPFQHHAGVLVDDGGHMLDLAHRADAVLARVDAPVALDVRQWMQRDFFPLHLQRYSKSRRKSPIYWPLATASGSYTLWLYYPLLTSQTLYTAVNDFLDPKLKLVRDDAAALRSKADARSREDERAFEALQVLEAELIELREALLQIAPTYRPNHHDGVQINAAPLWPLFRYKPWQKLLRETWAKLEKGEYDWAHLAMAYWPDRVREKCKTDKSLAIAHNLEHLYVPSEPKAAKPRGRKKASDA